MGDSKNTPTTCWDFSWEEPLFTMDGKSCAASQALVPPDSLTHPWGATWSWTTAGSSPCLEVTILPGGCTIKSQPLHSQPNSPIHLGCPSSAHDPGTKEQTNLSWGTQMADLKGLHHAANTSLTVFSVCGFRVCACLYKKDLAPSWPELRKAAERRHSNTMTACEEW